MPLALAPLGLHELLAGSMHAPVCKTQSKRETGSMFVSDTMGNYSRGSSDERQGTAMHEADARGVNKHVCADRVAQNQRWVANRETDVVTCD